jgi:hypothetical protein
VVTSVVAQAQVVTSVVAQAQVVTSVVVHHLAETLEEDHLAVAKMWVGDLVPVVKMLAVDRLLVVNPQLLRQVEMKAQVHLRVHHHPVVAQ